MNCAISSENIRTLLITKQKIPIQNKILLRRSRQQKGYDKQKHVPDNNKRCLLSKPKSPTPKMKDLIKKCPIQSKNAKNHAKNNIDSVKNVTFKEKPHIVQDSYTGHIQNLKQSGLELRYVLKQEYGKTPNYIKRNRHLEKEINKKVKYNSKENAPEAAIRFVEDEEKEAVLNGLRANLKEAEKQFLSLPIVTDTISKRNRKVYFENLLLKLQQDIETLERNDIIILVND